MGLAAICLLLTWPYSFWAWLWGAAFAKTLEANRLFGEKKFAQAGTQYRDALVDAPTEEALHFNLGTALYEQKQYDKAAEELEKATGVTDPLLAAKVHYNLGNCRFRQAEEALHTHQAEEYGKLLLQAIESYTRSLEFNSQDQDAKFNLELARKRYLERPPTPPQKENPQTPQTSQPETPQPPQNQPSPPSPQDQPQQSSPENQPQQPNSPPPQKRKAQPVQPPKENPDQQPEKGEKEQVAVRMSPEEAQRLLDSLEDEEKNTRKQLLQAPLGGPRNVEKDW